MRVAAIDVGTNSARLLVAEQQADGFRALDRRLAITRLGEGVERNRALAPEALQRTLAVIADYAAACGEFGAERILVIGTSAVRDARNRDVFFDGVERMIGSRPVLLSGEEEARTSFRGATYELKGSGPYLIVDIGGGSTELVHGSTEPAGACSMDIGCVRLFEKHLRSDPPAEAELAELRAEVAQVLRDAKAALGAPADARVIGVAGTVTQLALLNSGLAAYDPEVTHHSPLSHADVRKLARRLASLKFEQRSRVKGLEPGRVDVIVAGAEILLAVMDAFGASEVLVSETDLLDGIVLGLFDS